MSRTRRLNALYPAGLGVLGAVAVCVIMGLSVAAPPGVEDGFSSTVNGNAVFVELQNKDSDWNAINGDARWGWISYGADMNLFHAHITVFGLEAESWYMVTLWSDDPGTIELLGSVGYFGLEEKNYDDQGWADVAFFKTDSSGWAKQTLPDNNEESVPDPDGVPLPAVDMPLGEYSGVCVHVKYVGTGEIDWGLVATGGFVENEDKQAYNVYGVVELSFNLEGCTTVE